jgi:uncharacterized protein YjiS (DUF1127 family)
MLYAVQQIETEIGITMLSMIISQIRAFFRYRSNVRTLAVLSDRELSDIGLARHEIEFAAWRAARA